MKPQPTHPRASTIARYTAALACTLVAATTIAEPGEDGTGFELTWSTIDAGGGTSVGGGFELTGTIGQPDAGAAAAGSFELTGGFWVGGGPIVIPCPGDLNNDGIVNADDLAILLNAFGNSTAGDTNNDGITNADDLSILLNAFGQACP